VGVVARPPADARRWVSLAAICTAAGLVWLAFADLAVAIPTIADAFGADLSVLQWANNAFSLVAGALVIAAGRFGDVFGRRRMLQLGIVAFCASSIVAGLAQGVGVLIAGRGLMGVGAALILPATLALIPPQFSGKAQLTAFGVWQAVAWGGQAVGPAIGGVVTDGLGWRWLFWMNLPLGLAAFLVIRAVTPESDDPGASRHVDWPGLLSIGVAVFALLYALTAGPVRGWGDPLVVGLFVVAVVLAVAWVAIERRVAQPLVDLRLFGLRTFDGALTANLTMNLSFAGLSYLLVLWLQNVKGYSPVEAGLLLLPSTIGIFLFLPLGGRLDALRGGKPPVLVGLVVMALGFGMVGFMNSGSGLGLLAAALVVIGLGLGLLSTPISNTAVGDVPEDLDGTAAGLFKMSSMVGGALGVAVLSGLARAFTSHDAGDALHAAGLSSAQVERAQHVLVQSDSFQAALATLPRDTAARVSDAVVDAFSSGVAQTMVATSALVLVTAGVVAFLWPSGGPATTNATTTATTTDPS
jgi:EmrB/QacA subfamily drug resistance transporter